MKSILVPAILLSCLTVSCVVDRPLKQACLQATLAAIDSEIGRHNAWLKQASTPEEVSECKKELARLSTDKKKYQDMKPDEYVLPQKQTMPGKYIGGQISPSPQSRSGPFYLVIESSSSLKKEEKYLFEFYSVYKRSYGPFPNHYVYVSRAENYSYGEHR